MPTKFELERDAQRLARHQRVADQIKETDKGMSRETSRTLLLYRCVCFAGASGFNPRGRRVVTNPSAA